LGSIGYGDVVELPAAVRWRIKEKGWEIDMDPKAGLKASDTDNDSRVEARFPKVVAKNPSARRSSSRSRPRLKALKAATLSPLSSTRMSP